MIEGRPAEFAEVLVDQSPVGLLVVDASGVITFSSPALEDVTGYGVGDVVGTNIVDYLHPAAVEGLLESVAYVQNYPDQVMGPTSLTFIHADGKPRILEVYGRNLLDDPRVNGLIVAVRDNTTQYQVNDALIAFTEQGDTGEALRLLCASLLGLPIRGRTAIIAADDGRQLANVGFPDHVLSQAAALTPWRVAIDTGLPQMPPDLSQMPAALAAAAEAEGIPTIWALPINLPGPALGGAPIACLVVARSETGEPSINETITIKNVSRNVAMVLERDRLIAQLNTSATTDALTGLANRAALFGDEPGTAHASAVLYLDLDGFKPVNDGFGHAAGDEVLREVARRLAFAVRRGDQLGRVGGDEFIVRCLSPIDEPSVTALADRLLGVLQEPIAVPIDSVGGVASVTVGGSIGIALTHPDSGPASSPDDSLVHRADAALYEAKRAGRGRWHLAP